MASFNDDTQRRKRGSVIKCGTKTVNTERYRHAVESQRNKEKRGEP